MDSALVYLPYAAIVLALSMVCSLVAFVIAGIVVRSFFASRRRARSQRTVLWARAAYGLWTGGEDSADWARDRGIQSLSDWYGIGDDDGFWALIRELGAGQTGNAAWDQVRALDLLRIGVAAGYIRSDECWDAVRRIAEDLRRKYRSWEALAAAFEEGMLAWYDRRGITDPATRARVQQNLPFLRQQLWPAIPWDASI